MKGFTLLEVIIALIIAGMAAMVLFEARLTEAFLKLHLVPRHCRTLPDFSFTLCTKPKRLRKVRKQVLL
jgi:prepilin-type N-terminal cleavage/methylation domain-containing protein